jgi:hypothetical protein
MTKVYIEKDVSACRFGRDQGAIEERSSRAKGLRPIENPTIVAKLGASWVYRGTGRPHPVGRVGVWWHAAFVKDGESVEMTFDEPGQ